MSEGKFSMPDSQTRSREDLKSSSSSSSDIGAMPNSDSFSSFSPLRNVCSVLHRSPSQYKPGNSDLTVFFHRKVFSSKSPRKKRICELKRSAFDMNYSEN